MAGQDDRSMESAVVPKDKIKEVVAATAAASESDTIAAHKWNLGCGDKPLDGYQNKDIKSGDQAYPLVPHGKRVNKIEEIRASHILEHFERKDVLKVLTNWFDALAPGGWLKIAVPDFRKIAQWYLDRKRINTTGYVMGGQVDENDFHKSLFDEETLTKYLQAAGFGFIRRWQSEIDDCASLPISLNLMGKKPMFEDVKQVAAAVEKIEAEADGVVSCKVDTSKVMAIMSMPRIAFTDNMFCAMRALNPLKIDIRKGSGVFWGQVLTRLIEDAIAAGKEYVLTIDYDTWFTKEHVMYLLWLMQQHPEADAIIPVQVKRESNEIMLGIDGADGKPLKEIKLLDVTGPLIPTTRAHFGLSILRLSAFTDLKKPWFHAQPDPQGGWGDHRIDDDISFWNNFAACGKRAFIAKDINIGHIEMMCTFPGKIEDNWKPVQVGMFKLEESGPPEHCVPAVSKK